MQSISISNQSGEKLAAYLFLPEAEPSRFLVVCHGFRGAKENGGRIYGFARRVNELGYGLLAFDFSGSGQSEGDFSRMSLTRQAADLQAVIDYVDIHYKVPVVLLGRSFGGSTVIVGGAEDERVQAYVLWSTPIFMEETFTKILPAEYRGVPAGQVIHIRDEAGEFDLQAEFILDFARHDMDQYLLAMSTKPVLIIHAQDDELVPAENAVYMESRLTNSKLYLIDEAGHRFLTKTVAREDITIAWLQEQVRV